MIGNPYAKYTTTTAVTGNEAQQILFIYDEVTKLVSQAQKCAENGDIEGKYKLLAKVSDVFLALKVGITSTEDLLMREMDRFYSATIIQVNKLNSKPYEAEEFTKFISQIRKVREATAKSAEIEGFI